MFLARHLGISAYLMRNVDPESVARVASRDPPGESGGSKTSHFQ